MTQYDFYFGKTRLPVTPGKINININDKNTTVVLANDGEVSIPKKPGLTTYEFSFLLPTNLYPFARYMNGRGYENPEKYLTLLEKYKKKKKHFEFSVSYTNVNGQVRPYISQIVTVEDYKITHNAEDNNDVTVTIKLKQYKKFGTKVVKVKKSKPGKTTTEKTDTDSRPAGTNQPKTGTTYTVVKGDCLYNIAKKFYGDSSRYTDIYNANTDKIKNPSLIYPGQVFVIP